VARHSRNERWRGIRDGGREVRVLQDARENIACAVDRLGGAVSDAAWAMASNAGPRAFLGRVANVEKRILEALEMVYLAKSEAERAVTLSPPVTTEGE
jgi:hypothetical protein